MFPDKYTDIRTSVNEAEATVTPNLTFVSLQPQSLSLYED